MTDPVVVRVTVTSSWSLLTMPERTTTSHKEPFADGPRIFGWDLRGILILQSGCVTHLPRFNEEGRMKRLIAVLYKGATNCVPARPVKLGQREYSHVRLELDEAAITSFTACEPAAVDEAPAVTFGRQTRAQTCRNHTKQQQKIQKRTFRKLERDLSFHLLYCSVVSHKSPRASCLLAGR